MDTALGLSVRSTNGDVVDMKEGIVAGMVLELSVGDDSGDVVDVTERFLVGILVDMALGITAGDFDDDADVKDGFTEEILAGMILE